MTSDGWTVKKPTSICVGAAGNADLQKSFAAELVKLAPDVMLACGTANLAFLQQATPSIPIVFVQVSDPVAQHFVPNLTRPGGNITGFAAFEFSIGGKWIELLKQVSPALERVGLLFNPDVSPQNEYQLQAMTKDAPAFGVEIVPLRVHSDVEIEAAMASLAAQPNGGLVLPTDNYAISREKLISELALRYRLPSISGNRVELRGSGRVDVLRLSSQSYSANTVLPPATSIASSQARNRASFRSNCRPSSNSSSISRPPRYWALIVPPSVFASADEVIE